METKTTYYLSNLSIAEAEKLNQNIGNIKLDNIKGSLLNKLNQKGITLKAPIPDSEGIIFKPLPNPAPPPRHYQSAQELKLIPSVNYINTNLCVVNGFDVETETTANTAKIKIKCLIPGHKIESTFNDNILYDIDDPLGNPITENIAILLKIVPGVSNGFIAINFPTSNPKRVCLIPLSAQYFINGDNHPLRTIFDDGNSVHCYKIYEGVPLPIY